VPDAGQSAGDAGLSAGGEPGPGAGDAGSSAGDAGVSAGDAARRIGVAVTTIRTWDRRYGLGPTYREPGRHRETREDAPNASASANPTGVGSLCAYSRK